MNNELVPQPSWWKRNWKWVVPVSGCFTFILLLVIFATSLFFGITGAFEDSQPYEYALEQINTDEDLIKALGSPIVKDGYINGSFNNVNGKKSASLVVPVAGPKGTGTLYIEATGKENNWIYHLIRVEIENSYTFDILKPADGLKDL